MKKLSDCLRVVLILVVSLLWFISTSKASSIPDLFYLDADKTRLEWVLPGGIASTEFPFALQIARVSNEGKYSIGFTHLGYSEHDPDGKAASFTITLRPSVPKSIGPSSLVGGIGFELVDFQATELDVTLKADPVEEKRLRAALKLPRQIEKVDASLPYQIKWKGVDGVKIHSWLTMPDGLRWSIAGVAKLRLIFTIREKINSGCVKLWWERRIISDPAKEVLLDPATVAIELLADGCLEAEVVSSTSRSVSPQYVARIIEGLQKYLEPISHYSSLTLERIVTAAKPEAVQHEASAVIKLHTALAPGQFLNANPSYVKDLSGNSVGLAGLLGK